MDDRFLQAIRESFLSFVSHEVLVVIDDQANSLEKQVVRFLDYDSPCSSFSLVSPLQLLARTHSPFIHFPFPSLQINRFLPKKKKKKSLVNEQTATPSYLPSPLLTESALSTATAL